VQLEAAGVPTVLLATQPFLPMATGAATARDLPDARIVAVAHPLGGIDEDAVATRAETVINAVLARLRAPAEASHSS